MNKPISNDPERDLHHFLRLAAMQVKNRIKQAETNPNPKELAKLHLLEELIKEQMPDENIGAATGTSR